MAATSTRRAARSNTTSGGGLPAGVLRRRLLDWYALHARDLPWRRTRDPYAIWVSEVMLQQTQVAAVIGYYHRFLQAFPTIAALARAELPQVLAVWEGLGYYRRARQMHAAAQQIVAQHGGVFPRQAEAIRALPGIGRYTAGAIASIAFEHRAAILEANTIRLVARLLAHRADPKTAASQRRLWGAVESWLPAREVGRFNQALMELGSLVCTPREPACPSCPLRALCPSATGNLWRSIPRPARPTRWEQIQEAVLVVWHRGQLLVRRAAPNARWAGLWDFPRLPLAAGQPPDAAALAGQAVAALGLRLVRPSPFFALRYGVTRFRITATCFSATARSRQLAAGVEAQWLSPQQMAALPLNVSARRVLEQVLSGQGQAPPPRTARAAPAAPAPAVSARAATATARRSRSAARAPGTRRTAPNR